MKSDLRTQVEAIQQELGGIRRALSKPLEAEFANGALTVPQQRVLRAVAQMPGISLKDLSCAVSLAHSTVSGIVDRLEKRGVIERRPDETDGRVSRLFPSARVTNFIQETLPALIRGPLESAFERASPEDREAIKRGLRRLRELLEEA